MNGRGLTAEDVASMDTVIIDSTDNLADLLETVDISKPASSLPGNAEDDHPKSSEGTAVDSKTDTDVADNEFEQLIITLDDDDVPSSSGNGGAQGQFREFCYAHVLDTSSNVPQYEKLKETMARKVKFCFLLFSRKVEFCFFSLDFQKYFCEMS
ncbi:unnamed protein product [Gongylonema pulchrum]|uniref:TBP-binding domain-containing protein n=1 Tax=Gongylonema pulchrum TaxID=637853 RepID=A0A183ESY0_9BILA|nr:unnamed protein product [Gongylonema pulchrum]